MTSAVTGLPWTPADTAALRRAYAEGGIASALRALPDRTKSAIYHRAIVLEIATRRRRWTPVDDRRLRILWGGEPIGRVARALGRTVVTVYWRAQKLGLPLGKPRGYEYLSAAKDRAGLSSTSQLRRVLRWAGMPVRDAYTRGGRRPRRHHIVDPFDVDEAMAKWCAAETMESAAKRRGMVTETLVRWLLDAKVALTSAGPKKHRRVDSATIDRVVAERRAWYARSETLKEASARHGLTHGTLSDWLKAAGVTIGKPVARLDPTVVNRVVSERRARANCRAPRRGAA